MEAAGVVHQSCLFTGHRLLQFHANDQDCTFGMHKRSLMDKQSLKEWAQLKKMSKQRSMNASTSQQSNLCVKGVATKLPVTPNVNTTQPETTLQSTANFLTRNRLRRRDRDLPLC